jgi:hypothetical protein
MRAKFSETILFGNLEIIKAPVSTELLVAAKTNKFLPLHLISEKTLRIFNLCIFKKLRMRLLSSAATYSHRLAAMFNACTFGDNKADDDNKAAMVEASNNFLILISFKSFS